MTYQDKHNRSLSDTSRNQGWDGIGHWTGSAGETAVSDIGGDDQQTPIEAAFSRPATAQDDTGEASSSQPQARQDEADQQGSGSGCGDQQSCDQQALNRHDADQDGGGPQAQPATTASQPASNQPAPGQPAGDGAACGPQPANPSQPSPSQPGSAPPAQAEQSQDGASSSGCGEGTSPAASETSGGGVLELLSQALEGAMDIASGLIDLVQAQIQSFFEGLDGAIDAAMNFATTFSFSYWDGDSIESMSFSASAVATYDAETGQGEYAASVSLAAVGASQEEDGGIDAYAVSVGYAEGGAFGTNEDGLFESVNSSALSVSAAADDGEAAVVFSHAENQTEAISLAAPEQPQLADADDGTLSMDELAEGLSIAQSTAAAGAISSTGGGGIDASAGATGLGANLEFDGDGNLIDGGISSTGTSAEAHIDDLDELFGDDDAGQLPSGGFGQGNHPQPGEMAMMA